ncbi:MAG: hypothetical protein JWN73_361 [Betaproteobacteria bacterium]|nr:hypothetical protein [Betaproteobacteria bacterium]
MLTRLPQRFFAKPETARPPLPEILGLADEPLPRVIQPGYVDGFSALVESAHGPFIVNRHDTGVGYRLSSFNGLRCAGQFHLRPARRPAHHPPVRRAPCLEADPLSALHITRDNPCSPNC